MLVVGSEIYIIVDNAEECIANSVSVVFVNTIIKVR